MVFSSNITKSIQIIKCLQQYVNISYHIMDDEYTIEMIFNIIVETSTL